MATNDNKSTDAIPGLTNLPRCQACGSETYVVLGAPGVAPGDPKYDHMSYTLNCKGCARYHVAGGFSLPDDPSALGIMFHMLQQITDTSDEPSGVH